MQQSDETRFEDFVGLISGLYKEIQRIKASEGARLGLKGSDVMCLYYLERSKDGLTGADLARMAGVTRAAVSRTLAHLEEGGYVEVEDSGDAAVKYRAPVRLTTLGGESMNEADRIIREVLDTTGKTMGVEQREQMYASLRTILNTLRELGHLLPINNCRVPFERVRRAGALLSKFPARGPRKKGSTMSVRIITDSASDMSPAEHPALAVLPLSVTFGTDVYMDGVDIDHQRFYEMLVERDELPMTGQVNPYAFSQAIAEAREAGDEAVIITVGAKLSGTNQSARTALAEAPGGDVFIVDSNNVTLGERVLVEYALRLVDEGRSAAQIVAAVEAVCDRVVVIGLLETLEYLVRGGRLSVAAGAVGTLLNVKPVVAVEDGLIVQLGKARGSKNGRNLLNQKVEKAGGVDFSMPLALGYTGLSDAVLKKYIEDSAALWAGHIEGELPVHTIGATIGTHVGPGAVAIAFFQPTN